MLPLRSCSGWAFGTVHLMLVALVGIDVKITGWFKWAVTVNPVDYVLTADELIQRACGAPWVLRMTVLPC